MIFINLWYDSWHYDYVNHYVHEQSLRRFITNRDLLQLIMFPAFHAAHIASRCTKNSPEYIP